MLTLWRAELWTTVVLCLPSPTTWLILSAVNSSDVTQWSEDKTSNSCNTAKVNTGAYILKKSETVLRDNKIILNEIPSKCTQKKLLG